MQEFYRFRIYLKDSAIADIMNYGYESRGSVYHPNGNLM